jgi:hypothetical protein
MIAIEIAGSPGFPFCLTPHAGFPRMGREGKRMSKIGTMALGLLLLLGATARAASASQRSGTGPAPLARPTNPGGFFFCLGPSFAKLDYDSSSRQYLIEAGITVKRRLGFLAGVGYEIPLGQPLGQNLTVMPGIFFSSAGIKMIAAAGEVEQVMSGFLIPIDFKLNFHGPFITAGPYFGYLTSAKRVFDDGTEDKITEINNFHAGFSAGVGYEFRIKALTVMIRVGSQFGLSNFVKTVSSTDTNRAAHNALTAMIGLRI